MFLIKHVLLPPLGLYLLLIVCAVLRLDHFDWYVGISGLIGIVLLALAMPITSRFLLIHFDGVALDDPPPYRDAGAGAIVVFGGGAVYYDGQPERNECSHDSWERLRSAVAVYRESGLPIFVSGASGRSEPELRSVADLMAKELRDVFGVPAADIVIEPNARNTDENARLAAAILRDRSILKVILVTHHWHVPRAARSLRREGIEVIPVPVGINGPQRHFFTPTLGSLWTSHLAIREGLAQLWYRLAKR